MKDFTITRRRESVCDNNCEPIESVIENTINGSNVSNYDDFCEYINGLETSLLCQYLPNYSNRLTNKRKSFEDFVRMDNYLIIELRITINSKISNIPKRKKQKNDYSNNAVPTEMHGRELSQDHNPVHDMVSCALKCYNPQHCQSLYYFLTRMDHLNGYIYADEIQRLADHIDRMQKVINEPRKIENIYQKGSCNFGPGSTQNGNVLLNQ